MFPVSIKFLCAVMKLLDLKSFARRLAAEMCDVDESILVDRPISIVPLGLSTQTRDFPDDDLGHFHHRKEDAKNFNGPTTGNIHYSQLFEKARQQAIKEAQKYSSSAEGTEKYELIQGNIVAVIGQAGSGKTTLAKYLVRQVLNQGLYDAEYIFFLRFRDIDYCKRMTFLQFLTNNSSFFGNIVDESLIEQLNELPERDKVCIIFDGFDESIFKQKTKSLEANCSIYGTADAETFIKNLLCGNLLPKARKLFTLRPSQLYQLHDTIRPRFIVNILGLNDESQKHICRDICENEDACDQVLTFINDRPDLKVLCYVPVFCVLVMYCLNANFKSGNFAPETMDSTTTILVASLARFSKSNHLRGKKVSTRNLSYLAYTAFVSNRLVLEREDLNKAGISKHQADTFLTTRLGKEANTMLWKMAKTTYHFFDRLLHELFVAIHSIWFMEADEFFKILSKFKQDKFEMVAKLSFGIYNSVTQDYLSKLISSEELDLPSCKRKKEMLKEFVRNEMKSAKQITDFFRVCDWLYELRDDELTEEVASGLADEIRLTDEILPADISAFFYVLKLRKKPSLLTVEQPSVKGRRAVVWFVSPLRRIVERGYMKVKYV